MGKRVCGYCNGTGWYLFSFRRTPDGVTHRELVRCPILRSPEWPHPDALEDPPILEAPAGEVWFVRKERVGPSAAYFGV